MKILSLFLAVVLFGANASANLEIAAIAQASKTQYSGDSSGSSSGTNLGALLLFPLLPTLSLRTGVIQLNRKMTSDIPASLGLSGSYEHSSGVLAIPLNLQFDLPVTDLYVFGGLTYFKTQAVDCSTTNASYSCNTDKAPDDTVVNAGVGYNLFSVALFRLGLELESQWGTANVSTAASGEAKQSALNAGLVFALGF